MQSSLVFLMFVSSVLGCVCGGVSASLVNYVYKFKGTKYVDLLRVVLAVLVASLGGCCIYLLRLLDDGRESLLGGVLFSLFVVLSMVIIFYFQKKTGRARW